MSNELCEQRKTTLKENIKLYMQLIDQPTHVCEKCGRAANRKKLLCHPVPISPRKASRATYLVSGAPTASTSVDLDYP